MTNIISFPGLGIGEFELSKTAFSIFGKDIAWYGIIITFAIICGFLYSLYRSKQEGVLVDDMLDLAIFTILSAVIGARLYYVLSRLDIYDTFLKAIAIWEGGLAIYGGIIGGAIAIFCVTKYKKIKTAKVLDMVAPGVMIGQAIGRWGNFFNAEAHGVETTLPWKMGIFDSFDSKTYYYHPTFLYECLWNILGFVIINSFYKKKKYDGQIAIMYLAWYGFGRMLIEGLRTDSLYVGSFRISQLIGGVCFVAGVFVLIIMRVIMGRKNSDDKEYTNLFDKTVKKKQKFENDYSSQFAGLVDKNDEEVEISDDEKGENNG